MQYQVVIEESMTHVDDDGTGLDVVCIISRMRRWAW